MTSQIIFKIDKSVKDKAMKKAQTDGIAFASVLKLATQAYIAGDFYVRLIVRPKLNLKTRRELQKMRKDLKAGKNISPAFRDAKSAIAYLKGR